MAIVLEPDAAAQAAEEQKSVDMIQNARNDAAMLLEQDDSFLDVSTLRKRKHFARFAELSDL